MKNKGFTLIEVLIAVAVLAIALIAVLRVINVAINNSNYLQQKTLAHWVAQNVAAQAEVGVMLIPAAGGMQSGEQTMLGQKFQWQMHVTSVSNYPMLKLSIQVNDASNKKSLDVLQTYVAGQAGQR